MSKKGRSFLSHDQAGFSLIEAMVGLLIATITGLAISTLTVTLNQQARQSSLRVDSISLVNEITALLSDPAVCKKNFEGKSFELIPEKDLKEILNRDGIAFYKTFNPAAKQYLGNSKYKILGMSVDQSKAGASASNKTTTLIIRMATEKLNSAESDSDPNRELVRTIQLSYTDSGPNISSCRSIGGITDIWTRKLTAGHYNDIFYSGGRVGIGVNDPSFNLDIGGDGSEFNPNIILRETGHTTSKRASMVMGDWNIGQDTKGDGTRNFFIWQGGTTSAFRMNISETGNIGIGTTTPMTKLEVDGGIRPGHASVGTSCAGTPEGTFSYDRVSHVPVFCNQHAQWSRMGGGGGITPGSPCTSSQFSKNTGIIVYSPDSLGATAFCCGYGGTRYAFSLFQVMFCEAL